MRRGKLYPTQKKMILNFMGVPISEVPKTVREVDIKLNALKMSNMDLYDEAYNILVKKKYPGSDKIQQKVIPFIEASTILRDEADNLENGALSKISEQYQKLSEELVKEIGKETTERINAEAKKFNRIEIKVGKSKAKKLTGDDIVPEEFERLLQLASSRMNILMTGPTGCGKTHVAGLLAKHLDLDFSSQSCSAGVSESVFSGWLIPTGAAGKFEYVQSEFVRLYENGGVFLFDEMDAADSNLLVFLNQAIANGKFVVPQRYKKPIVKRHKDFIAVAATNTNGSGADVLYHGRNALDESTLDRFRVGTVQMDYSAQVEEKLIPNNILTWGREVREKIKINHLSKVMSTRTMLDAKIMQDDHGWTSEQVEAGYFSSWSKEELAVIGRVA